jgi:hypothetical protein
MYLNNLWHLLPSAQQDQSEKEKSTRITNLDVHTKNEPKTAEPSPINQSAAKTDINQDQTLINNYQQQQQQYQVPDLSYDLNKLDLQVDSKPIDLQQQYQHQQSLPFYPQQQQQQVSNLEQQSIASNNYNYMYSDLQHLQQQQQTITNINPNESQNYIADQTKPFYNHQDSNNSNTTPSYLESKSQTAFNYPVNQNQNNSYTLPPPLSSQQPPQQRRSSTANSVIGAGAILTSSRSRQSSTSTSYEPTNQIVAPFNPYQQNKQQSTQNLSQFPSSQIFDPNVLQSQTMSRSATYPSNTNQTDSSQIFSQKIKDPINEEPSSSKENLDDDDDEFRKDSSKRTNKDQLQNDNKVFI